MKFKTIAMTGVMSLAGLGLIGAGAHAVFTTTTASSQPMIAGTPGVALWSSLATNTCTTEAIAQAYPTTCDTITLPLATVGSTFDLPTAVGVVNVGSIPVTLTSLYVTDSYPGDSSPGWYLQQGLGFCVSGLGMSSNTALISFPGFDSAPDTFLGGASLTVGASGTYYMDFYAGEASSVCGGSANAPLASGAEGGSDTVTLTVGYTG